MVRLEIESSIWWACVVWVALSRFISRRMTVRKFHVDDSLMLLALAFYTTLVVTINIVRHTSSNLLPPGFDVSSLTPQEKDDREYGSKLILVVEQSQCATIWLAKACLIILYYRLTQFRWENWGIRILGAYVGITFVVMEILYFGVWCQPFHEYWAVPTDSIQCDAATNHLITNAVFNLTSDVALLAIGLPMFLRMKLPLQKKLPVVLVFSLGIFVILAAILNKVYSFTEPFGDMWTYWYVRESSTALLVANLPFVWHFWRKITGLDTMLATGRRGTTQIDVSGSEENNRRMDSMLDLSGFLAEGPPGEREKQTNSNAALGPLGRVRSGGSVQFMFGKRPSKGELPSAGDSCHENVPPKAVIHEQPPRQTLRRDSDPNQQPSSVPVFSNVPSMASSVTADSFV